MNNLNQEQKKAVEHTGNPLLIIAGAGTGKTTVITQKIGWIAEQELAKTDEILALTFTEKAAGEMQERIDKLMQYGYVDLWIMTFHGFCEKILKQHGLDIGLPTNFKLLNEFQQWVLIKKNLDKFKLDYYQPMGNPTKFISALLRHFSRAKDENISPGQYLEYAEELQQNLDSKMSGDTIKIKLKGVLDLDGKVDQEVLTHEMGRINEVANAYHVYQNLLLENSVLDFGDLINYTLKLFRERPAILAKYQQQFKHVLVDEFQDTNWAQYELMKLLKPKGENLIAVLDDDQSIYKFRGASVSNVLQFKNDFSNAEEILLTQNYRSTQNILDLSYNFIQLNNPNRLECRLDKKIDKKLISNIKEDSVIEVLQGSDLQDEVVLVIEKIAELKIKDKDCNYNDFAILVRANNSAKEFVNALEIAGLPYIFLASKGLYNKPVIMDIIAYLSLLNNYHENTAMYRVLNIPVFKFEHEEILKIINLAKKKAWSIYETVKYTSNFTENFAIKAGQIINLIGKHIVMVHEKKVNEVIQAFLKDSGYLKYLSEQEDQKVKDTMRELNAFMRRIKEFENSTEEASVKNFLAELELEMESGEQGSLSVDPEAGPEMIKVSTIHAAKGLEFKYVFIVNMVDLRFPTTERKDPISLPDALVKEILPEGDIHLEEERRLFYVAMTRAKQGLYFSWAPDYGGTRKKKPSRFLSELRIENLELRINDDEKTHNFIDAQIKQPKIETTKPIYELPKYYSYSQLSSYKNCPYQYRFGSVLKIPTGGNANFSFGNTMHLTLQKFFGLMMHGQNAQQGDLFALTPAFAEASAGKPNPSVDDLLKLYEESWIDEWYASKEEKEERRKKGREILKEFYSKHKDNWPKVIGLEQRFKLKLNDYIISGGIDRIDNCDPPSPNCFGEASGANVQIVDYKTGTPKQAGKITIDNKEQLLIYQMATEEVLKKKVANLQFYYLDNNSEIDFLGTNDEKLNLQEKLLDRIKEIETSIKTDNFPPKPSQLCKFCNFNNICEHRQM